MNPAEPAHEAPASTPPSYRNRRTGLLIFGIVQILLGGLCLLLVVLMIVSLVILPPGNRPPVTLQMMLPGLLIYLALGAASISLGIGSILCRRWARAMTLIFAWPALVAGCLTVPMMAWMLPKILAAASTGPQAIPAGMLTGIIVMEIALLSFFLILLPGVTILFYRSPHVRMTCEALDPKTRWTDACPLPVLGVAWVKFWGGVFLIAIAGTRFSVFPVFGVVLTGWTGSLAMAAIGVLWIGLSWGWYRLKPSAWWISILVVAGLGISQVSTFSRVDLMEIYKGLGYPQAQLDYMKQSQAWITREFMAWTCLGWMAPAVGYLIWTRRFFVGRNSASA